MVIICERNRANISTMVNYKMIYTSSTKSAFLYNVNHLHSFIKIPLECHKKGYFQSLDTPVYGFFVEMKFYTSTRS